MTTKTKIVAVLAGLLALAVAWVVWPGTDLPNPAPAGTAASDGRTVEHGGLREADRAGPPAEEPAREAIPSAEPAAATTGTLLVHVQYADEPKAAAGLTVLVAPPGGDFRVGLLRAVTDAEGTARFEGLAPGSVWARTTVRPGFTVPAQIAAGATCECTLRLEGGMTLNGIVVDPAGVPVGAALVEAYSARSSQADADQIAVTGADGTFSVRECEWIILVGARAPGHAASQLYSRVGKPGAVEQVRIELRAAGGAVEGTVLGPAGAPVAAAVVRIGAGNTTAIMSTPEGAPPLPAQVRTDATGRFVAIGLPAGTQPVAVRAAGLAPWLGTCEVAAGSTVALRIVMSPGVTCTGLVRGEHGQPAPAVDVSVGDRGDFVLLRTRTGADGTFKLTGLPVGEFVLRARKDKLGKASARLHGQSGETLRCELQLSNGLALRGRVLDDAGNPVVSGELRCETVDEAARWAQNTFTDKAGRFLVAECPPGRLLRVQLSAPDHLPLLRNGIDPRTGELELRLARDTTPKARIHGRLLRPDGSAAKGESVDATRFQQRGASTEVKSDDGTFTIEVPAGEWSIRVNVEGHPEIRVEQQKLEPGAIWDLDTLQLTIGGTLLVRDAGEGQLDYLVLNADEHFVCGLYTPVPPLRSQLLAPGDYVLLAKKDGIAAQALPFTIRSEQETELAVTRPAGVRQYVEFVLPAGGERPRSVGFQVRRDGKLLLIDATPSDSTGPLARELWLAPGSYSLATRNRQPESTASFTVGNAEGPAVRIALR